MTHHASSRAQQRSGLLGALVWLFPARFRRAYGAAFRDAILHLANEPRHRGPVGRARLWRVVLADVARAAPTEWRDALTPAARPAHRRPRTAGDRMDAFLQDLRYALRSVRRSPGFAAVVIVSLALGIGANTLVYSVLDGVVLRPFAFPDADRLVSVGVIVPKISGDRQFIESLSPPEYVDIRAATPSLTRVAAFDLGNRAVSGGDRPERVFTAFVWGDPLATIGLTPTLGRSFRDEETTSAGSAVAVISHRLWQSRFGGDSAIVGRAIRVNGQPLTVIGVMPPQALLFGTDLWMPMGIDPMRIPRNARQYAILARVAPDASLADVNRELAQVAARTDRDHRAENPNYEGWRLEAAPWAEAVTSAGGIRTAGFILQGAVVLVLLIACANVAGLLLSRAATRQQEIAMRRALGAHGVRLGRQLLTEALVLSVIGGAAGLVIAVAFMAPLTRAMPDMVQSLGVAVRPNGRVLLVTLAASALVGMIFGLAPAVQLVRRRVSVLFGQGSARATIGRSGRRLRAGFLAVQVALCVVLLVASGLLLRSFSALRRVELGFAPQQVLTMRLSLPQEKYPPQRIAPTIDDIVSRLQAIPGVRGAAAATQFPPNNAFAAPLALRGESLADAAARVVDVTNVTPGFFAALGFSLRQGRLFGQSDDERSPRVAVVNETAARRFFGGRSPIGDVVTLGDSANNERMEIVGVVGDARNRGLDAPVAPEVFVPAAQQRVMWNSQFFLLTRTAGDPMAALSAVREAVRSVDADQPVYAISTIEREMGNALVERRAAMVFLLAFGAISLALACVGIFGLVSYSVNERVREIGIRVALGAGVRDVRGLVLRQTLTVVGIGVVVGLAGAAAASGALRALVYGVTPTDPMTLTFVALLLPAVALFAAALPMRRATRIDPVEALRS